MKPKEVVEIIEPKKIIVGDKKAPVTIMQFGDYESEECAKVNEVVAALLETYPDKVNFNFRHFPLLKIHQKAHKAAEAAICAAQESPEMFWELHKELFKNRRNLGIISLKSYAKEVGTSNKKFLDELINGMYGWNVQDDLKEGIQMGVTTVPTFFINGELFDKEPTFKNLSSYILALSDKGGEVKKTVAKKAKVVAE
ncbi:MAG: thioredoxin domain-containing protein [Pedobacter sp.]|nr:thioredoxin domain-containing protein [Chitinophagaceae bacterium]